MDKQTAIKLAGSQSALARIFVIERSAVHQWKTIPPLRIYQLKELRPEWFNDPSNTNQSPPERPTNLS
jgi:hypothetical protein